MQKLCQYVLKMSMWWVPFKQLRNWIEHNGLKKKNGAVTYFFALKWSFTINCQPSCIGRWSVVIFFFEYVKSGRVMVRCMRTVWNSCAKIDDMWLSNKKATQTLKASFFSMKSNRKNIQMIHFVKWYDCKFGLYSLVPAVYSACLHCNRLHSHKKSTAIIWPT